jgi:hypothetical protein
VHPSGKTLSKTCPTLKAARKVEVKFKTAVIDETILGIKTPAPTVSCARAVSIGAYTYRSVESILKKDLDRQPLQPSAEAGSLVHRNIREQHYYHQMEEKPC